MSSNKKQPYIDHKGDIIMQLPDWEGDIAIETSAGEMLSYVSGKELYEWLKSLYEDETNDT